MSIETLQFLKELLLRQSIPVGDPGLIDLAATATKALEEINAAILEAQKSNS